MRKDGIQLKNIDPMRKLMPYLFKTRNGSIVYSKEEIEIDIAREYLKKINKENSNLNISTFELIITAMVRTIAMYPYLNRFIAAKKIFARNNVSLSFVVLKKLNGKSEESTAKIYFDKNETLFSVGKKVKAAINLSRSNVQKDDDRLMTLIAKLPSPLLTFTASMFNWLSNVGLLPTFLMESIPLYSSIYISNLGSIGHDALYHHLYEWGTTSIFITMGKITKKDDKSTLNVVFSIDERIADGIYLVNALRYFTNLLQHPEKLQIPPDKIVEDDGI